MKNKLLVKLSSNNVIEDTIYFIRGQRVILDSDLAKLYGISTKVLNQAIKRNKDRFPEDFAFKLKIKEWDNWRAKEKVKCKDEVKKKRDPQKLSQ